MNAKLGQQDLSNLGFDLDILLLCQTLGCFLV